jgi:hypothetical protein
VVDFSVDKYTMFNSLGKDECDSRQIPESILMAKTAEVLELPAFDAAALTSQIAEIRVQAHNRLTFVFYDGHAVTVDWQNPSRRESWTEEMKLAARERQLNINEQRRKTL